MKIYVGTSGWNYRHWKNRVYPRDLAADAWLNYYARQFATVELNASFYRLPSEAAVKRWRDGTPPGFVFAYKASRFITHFKQLVNAQSSVELSMSRARLLGSKLGPVLYQLPPSLTRADDRLQSFCRELDPHYRNVFEFRDDSWYSEEIFGLLRRHGIGFCVHDMRGSASPLLATASFGYVRFHGPAAQKYAGRYSRPMLADWARRLKDFAGGLDAVYVYFNNDHLGYAVENARTLHELLGFAAAV
jgi:uncharacterized protein YecE (DUF72 family)